MSEVFSQLVERFQKRVVDWWDYVDKERNFYPRREEFERKRNEAKYAIYKAFTELEEENRALQRRVEDLEKLCSQAYQIVGSLSSDAGMFDHPSTTKALDNLSMAAAGKLLPHAELLPFPAAGRVEWTTTKPDKPGWYWWRTPQITLAVYIEFGEQGNGLVSFAYGERYRCLKDMNGEWQGPITPHEARG